MLLPSLTTTTDDPLRNAPKLLVPPTPTRRRSSNDSFSATNSVMEQIETIRRTSLSTEIKPTVDEVTEILRERRQRIKRKKT